MFEDKYNLSLEECIFVAKRNIVDTIYSEARLEGVNITFPETYDIYEGRTVASLSVDDTVKVNNLKHAWQFVFDTIDYPIDLRYIKQLNHLIGFNLVPLSGSLRTSDVHIGGTNWKPDIPDSDVVSYQIEKILSEKTSVTEKAITLMLYLMRSQLFYDGNKRVAQISANQYLIQNGKGIISIPTDKQKQFFSLLIDFYESDDMSDIKQFVYDNAVTGIELTKDNKNKSFDEEFDENFFYTKKPKTKGMSL